MDKEVVLNLLRDIYVHKYVGASSVEVLTFAIEKGLLERTEIGNLTLSKKGLSFLEGDTPWENI